MKVRIIDEQNMKTIHTAVFKKELRCQAGWSVLESCVDASLVPGGGIPALLIPAGRLDLASTGVGELSWCVELRDHNPQHLG